ncbi:hypothetical protein VPHF86_0051 [Vibrio phage F86]
MPRFRGFFMFIVRETRVIMLSRRLYYANSD